MAHGEVKSYDPETRIEFPTIITNEGGGYMSGLHEFWCPVDGLYYFAHSSMGFEETPGITEIWMDDTRLVTCHAADYRHPAASNSVVVHCNSGSKVYVECSHSNACTVFGTYYDRGNTVTFSGYLLSSDD